MGEETQTQEQSTATEYEGETESGHTHDADCLKILGEDELGQLLSDEDRQLLADLVGRLGEKIIAEEREKKSEVREAAFAMIEHRLRKDAERGAPAMSTMLDSPDAAKTAVRQLVDIAAVLLDRLYPDAASEEELADCWVRLVQSEREQHAREHAQAEADAHEPVVDLREQEAAQQ